MVGGGNNAFIGAVHRAAALMDNRIELVCGCFSSHPDISLASGREYFLPDNRIYFSHAEMIEKESALPDGERMDFISIVTPNVTHFEPAMMALDKGFDVVIEKPMTFTLEQAKQLRQKVMQTGRTLALTQTYSAYPAVKEARERFAKGGGVRHRAQDIRRVPAGVAHNAHRAQPREQRRMAYRPPSVRARRDAWAT